MILTDNIYIYYIHIIIYHSGHKSYLKSHKYMSIMLYIYIYISPHSPKSPKKHRPRKAGDYRGCGLWGILAAEGISEPWMGCGCLECLGCGFGDSWIQ